MTRIRPHRKAAQGSSTLLVLALVSVAAHAGVIATADFGRGGSKRSTFRGAEEVEFRFSCRADAALAASARGMRCLMPGVARQRCEMESLANFRADLTVCDGLSEASESGAVAFMTEAEIEALTPEKLMEIPALDELEAAKLIEDEIDKKVEEAEKQVTTPAVSGQVVEITQPDVEMVPDKARFLSEFNSAVAKESVARGSTEDMVNAPAPKELPVAADAPELPDDPSGEASDDSSKLAKAESKPSETPSDNSNPSRSPLLAMRAQDFLKERYAGNRLGSDFLEKGGLAKDKGSGGTDQRGQEAQDGQEAVNSGGGQRPMDLRPSQETLARLAGGGSVDKLEGVASGDFTALNSKKWKYATFFNRMKRQVARNWHPDVIYAQRDPTGNVYGVKDRVTVLEVSLTADGRVDGAVILKPSGVRFLDEEAISSFERAAPFVNPPSALVVNGLITFNFGFHFRVGTRRDSWNLFRAP